MQLTKLDVTTQLTIAFAAMFVGVLTCLALGYAWLPAAEQGRWLISGVIILAFIAVAAVLAISGLRAAMQSLLAPVSQIAAGDLSVKFNDASGELGAMSRALQSVNDHLARILKEVNSGMSTVLGTSSQISRDNSLLRARSNEVASSLGRTASAMTQLHATVQQNTEHALQADKLVTSASDHMRSGGETMSQVVAAMGSIRESSRKIVDIIGVIDSIAFQTNILALNAAVEAARAGDQGKGFAVVASEVRTLAQRSASAAKEIKSLIHASSETVNQGAKLVDTAGKAMGEIVSSVESVATIVKSISQASIEQREGIATMNDSINDCSRKTQESASIVAEVIKSADALNQGAVTLKKSIAIFKTGERETATLEEAKAMLDKAVAFAREHGTRAFIEEANKGVPNMFVDRDLYVFAVRVSDYLYVAHPINPRAVGLDCRRTKDANGRAFAKEYVELAMRDGSGVVEYQWHHPITHEVKDKQSFVQLVDDIVLVCGAYKDAA